MDNKSSNLLTKIENKVENYYSKIKNFCIEYKTEILSITTITFGGGTFLLGYKYKISDKALNKATEKIGILLNDLNEKKEIINIQETLIKDKNKRIEYLTNMHYIKDMFYDRAISDGTRNGSSYCAQQLAFKRWS